MKKIYALSLALICFFAGFSQKKWLTLQEAMLNARTTLAPSNLKMLQFIKGTNDYVYLKKISGSDIWVRSSFNTSKETEYLNLTQVNQRLRTASLDTLTSMPLIQFSRDEWTIVVKGQKYSFSNVSASFRKLIGKEFAAMNNLDESTAGYLAYLDNNNLFISLGNEKRQITTDGSSNIVYASSVHRDEFGITKGTFWSNNGKLLAFYRMDQSMVKDYPMLDWTNRPASVEQIKYPMAGDSSHQVTLQVCNAENGELVKIQTTGDPEHYLTNITWSPDDKFIYIAELNRDQNEMQLNQYDAASGKYIKTLFTEKSEKYVEPLVPILFVKNHPDQFVWQSRKDGWNHLYLFKSDGTPLQQLTSGNWEVVEVKGFDEKGDNLFYVSTQQSPSSRNLYKLNLKSGKCIPITQGSFVHNTSVSSDGNFVMDNYSNIDNPRTIQLINVRKGTSKILLQAEDPLKEYAKGQLSLFSIKNPNSNIDLYCRMYKPVDFDSTKKYPVLVYWYGGPHNQLITNSWNGGAGDYWFQFMAERGYLVFSMDVRGSSYRGRDFEQSIFRSVGKKQMEDLKVGTDYLTSLSYVDANRMGLFGWSFGGFLTTNFMLTYPNVFKAAVAGGPVMDWKYYEIMYTERYMDAPQKNPEGYQETNLIARAGELKGKLLLIHGLQDNVVVQQHSVNFVKSAVDKNIQIDYMIYPGHEHNVIGKDRAHLYQKVTDYFMQHLN